MLEDYSKGDEPIPGYRLEKLLGRGGFGEVWRAIGPGSVGVALKIINLDDQHARKELRAIQMVKNIRHPNLLSIFGFWLKDEDGAFIPVGTPGDESPAGEGRMAQLFISMSLGDKNLYDRLRECKKKDLPGIPPAELLNYMEDAAHGIDHLNQPTHDLGAGPVAIQHCDIKPQNILIVGDGAQVCDFGLVRALRDTHVTAHSGGLGAVIYTAPELLKNNRPSPTTDQYSLALSYYELRTGTLPFEGRKAVEQIIAAHTNGELDFSKLTRSEQAVLKRAAALDPEKRFPTTEEMVRALRQAWQEKIQTIDFLTWPQPGREIVGYKLVRLLGQRDNQQDWEAEAPGGVKAALKLIANTQAESLSRELRALDLLMGVEHNNLVELHARFVLDAQGQLLPDEAGDRTDAPPPGAVVIVGKRYGETLLDVLRAHQKKGQAGIPAELLVYYMKQAARALDYLNVVVSIQHRNVSPESLLLVGETIKVSDFSLARVQESAVGATAAKGRGLDPFFAAPEQLAGTASSTGDQYSLALTYYQLRTGALPFPQLGQAQPATLANRGPLDLGLLPEPERAVLRQATAPRPEQRFPSCSEMVEALAEACFQAPENASLSTNAHPDTLDAGAEAAMPAAAETPVPPSEDPRAAQARKLYDTGWGKELGYSSFDSYLESIPPVPSWPADWEDRFDRTVLVDERLPLKKMCELLQVHFLGDDETFVDFSPEKGKKDVYWIRCQDGRKYHDQSVRQFRRSAPAFETGMTVHEGFALLVQDRKVLDDHVLFLPGSVLRRRGLVAFLRPWEQGLLLDWVWSSHNDPQYGPGSRGLISFQEICEDVRVTQARKIFDAGWGNDLGCRTFEEYLESIPPLPEWPAKWEAYFDRSVLVDARVPLKRMCELLNIEFLGDEETFVPYLPERLDQKIYWIRCQDGRKYHNQSVRDFRRLSVFDEVGMMTTEGIALLIQDRAALKNHVMVLPGSVLRRRGLVAFLRPWGEGVLLDWIWSSHADAQYGSASCWNG